MVSAPTIELSSLSMADSLILMVLALVVFGPRRLPQIGRQIGKLMYEFRKASNDFKFQMEEELRNAEDADRRKREEAERQLALSSSAQSAGTIEAQTGYGATETATPSPYPSPYPGEGTYPKEYPPETPAAAVEPSQPAESSPHIHPPTTGEQVSAAAPNAAAAETNAAAENDAIVSSTGPGTVSGEVVPAEPASTSTEPTGHHG